MVNFSLTDGAIAWILLIYVLLALWMGHQSKHLRFAAFEIFAIVFIFWSVHLGWSAFVVAGILMALVVFVKWMNFLDEMHKARHDVVFETIVPSGTKPANHRFTGYPYTKTDGLKPRFIPPHEQLDLPKEE